jgi:paraquat-inducible protein A
LAALVFTASFTIPPAQNARIGVVRLLGDVCRSCRFSSAKHVFRVVEEIGRWSMVDPLTIACFVPVLQFNGSLTAMPSRRSPFSAVVILTTLAAQFSIRARCGTRRSRIDE